MMVKVCSAWKLLLIKVDLSTFCVDEFASPLHYGSSTATALSYLNASPKYRCRSDDAILNRFDGLGPGRRILIKKNIHSHVTVRR